VHSDITPIKSTPTGATVEDIWNSRVKRLMLALTTPFYSMLSFWLARVQCCAKLMVSQMEIKSGWQAWLAFPIGFKLLLKPTTIQSVLG
jgi:hypothetical protein